MTKEESDGLQVGDRVLVKYTSVTGSVIRVGHSYVGARADCELGEQWFHHAEIERLLALVDNRDDIIQGLMDENTALREGRQTPPEIKSLKEWRDANAEIERLRKALDQVLQVTGITREYKRIADIYRPNPHPWLKIPCINGNGGGFRLDINLADVAPELYAYLREKEANHGN